MTKSDFTYKLLFDQHIISIVDLNRGRMSVTNDIENVILSICKENGLEVFDWKVIYQDSEGQWDGFDSTKSNFIALNCTNEKDAVTKIQKLGNTISQIINDK